MAGMHEELGRHLKHPASGEVAAVVDRTAPGVGVEAYDPDALAVLSANAEQRFIAHEEADAPDDVEALARALLAATYRTGNPPPFEAVDSVYRHRAELLLASDWLAARDADLTARAEAATAERIAQAIEATFADPDRERPRKAGAEFATDFANDAEWCAQIARAAAASYTRDGADGEADHG